MIAQSDVCDEPSLLFWRLGPPNGDCLRPAKSDEGILELQQQDRWQASRDRFMLGRPVCQRHAEDNHVVLQPNASVRRDSGKKPADSNVARFHDADGRGNALLVQQAQESPHQQAANPVPLPGVVDPDGKLDAAGSYRRRGGESEHLFKAFGMTSIARDQRNLLAGQDLVEVTLRENRQGIVKAVTARLWTASVNRLSNACRSVGFASEEIMQLSCRSGTVVWSASVSRTCVVGV